MEYWKSTILWPNFPTDPFTISIPSMASHSAERLSILESASLAGAHGVERHSEKVSGKIASNRISAQKFAPFIVSPLCG